MTIRVHRGIHSLIAVAMLIGMASVMTVTVASVLTGQVDVLAGNLECELSNVLLYDTGEERAYFASMLTNTGSAAANSSSMGFIDEKNTEYGFSKSTVLIPGETWNESGSFSASLEANTDYVVRAHITSTDGSRADCSTTYRTS